MTRRTPSLLGLIAGAVLAVALGAPGAASAISDGDPCSPFWTEDTPATVSLTADPAAVSTSQGVIFDASVVTQGTADKWTWVASDGACEPTSTETDPVASYTWDFGDGSPLEHDPASVTTTAHTFVKAGTYIVTLTATEQNCQAGPAAHCFTSQTTQAITVADRPPDALFTAPASVTTGRTASFDASASSDPDGTVTAYHWDFGDGRSEDTPGPATFHTYATSGLKTVLLTVTDDNGSTGQEKRLVSVIDRPPTASFTTPSTVSAGRPATFDAAASSDPDGTVRSYAWDFGDGGTSTTSGAAATHTYARPGVITVSLTVTDDSGSTAHTQRTITVRGGPPSAAFSGPGRIAVKRAARFDANASSAPGGTITSYRWDFGDGRTLTTTNAAVTHAYARPGVVTVILAVTDDSGGTARAARRLTVVAGACVVPRLVGRTLAAGRKLLSRQGCRLGKVTHRRARHGRKGHVVRQSLHPGTTRRAGTAVGVTVSA